MRFVVTPMSVRSSPTRAPLSSLAGALGGALIASVSPGCGAADPAIAPKLVAAEQEPPPPPPPPLHVASGYEAWTGGPLGNGCSVRALPASPTCVGAGRCPVAGNEVATCGAPVADVILAGGTAVFGFQGFQSQSVKGFGYWPAGEGVRTVGADGAETKAALSGDGKVYVVRVEQGRLVDYRVGSEALVRRTWAGALAPDDHLMSAESVGDSLIARVAVRSYSPSSRDVIAGPSGTFQSRDVPAPPGSWSYPNVVTHSSDRQGVGLAYGPAGVGVIADQATWMVPHTVARTAAARDILLPVEGQPHPVLAFKSFDGGERSGAHVLFPKAPFARGSRVPVTDVHLLAGRLERKNDCPQRPDATPRVCTRTEIDSQGVALARTGDGRVWVSFLVTRREHRARFQIVCPPPPRCAPGEPCRQAPCEDRQSDVRDSVRHELMVYRLGTGGAGAELGYSYELADSAGVDILVGLDMAAIGSELHIAFKFGDFKVRRVRLDTSAMSPVALAADGVARIETELTPVP